MATTSQHDPVTPDAPASSGGGVATVLTGAMLLLLLGGIAVYVLATDGFYDAIPVFAMIALALAALLGERVSATVRDAATDGNGAAKRVSSWGSGLAERSWLLPALGFLAVIVILGERPDRVRAPSSALPLR